MSGGGIDGSWTSNDEIACSRLNFSTHVTKPQPSALQIVRTGNILPVTLVTMGGIVAAGLYSHGTLIGGLAGGLAGRLQECLLGGTRFIATVQSVHGTQILVKIEPI